MLKLTNLRRITLYLFLFSINFENINILGLGSAARLTGLLYFATILPSINSFLQTKGITEYLRTIFIFWFFLTIISLLYINLYSYYFIDIAILLNIFFFWFLTNHERFNPGIMSEGILFFSFGTIVLAILYYNGIGIEIVHGRVRIFGDNSNAIGMRCSIAIITLLYTVAYNNMALKKWRYLLLIPIPILITLMFETGSRVALISLSLSFIVGSLLFKTKKVWQKIIVIVFAFSASLYFFQLLEQSDILMKRMLLTTEDGSLGGREDIWPVLIPLIQDNIIWGVGKTGYHSFSMKVFGQGKSPHNVFLEVLAYTGIIGLIMYLHFLYLVVKQSLKIIDTNKFILPLLLVIHLLGLIFSGQALSVKIAWIIIAFTVGTVFYKEKKVLK